MECPDCGYLTSKLAPVCILRTAVQGRLSHYIDQQVDCQVNQQFQRT